MQFGLQVNPYFAGATGNPWDAVTGAAQALDASAFDSLWLYDHFLYEGGYSGHPVPEPVWDLLAETLHRCPIRAIIVERDGDFHPTAEIAADLRRATHYSRLREPKRAATSRRTRAKTTPAGCRTARPCRGT